MNTDGTVLSPDDTMTDEPVSSTLNYDERLAQRANATAIVKKYMLIAGGVGIIPFPLLDQMTVGGLLAKMVYDMAPLYGVKLSDNKIKTTVAAVLGGAHTQWITYYLVSKITPLTPMVALITRPFVSAAIVYAIGKLFINHFESGAWIRYKEPF